MTDDLNALADRVEALAPIDIWDALLGLITGDARFATHLSEAPPTPPAAQQEGQR